MKRFGLIGHPISHSLSPALFKAAYGGKYPYDLIEGENFEKAYETFMDEYDAINVTAPFKELACSKADELDEECRIIGASNILIKDGENQHIIAKNSDIEGVVGSLQAVGMDKGLSKRALIAGCGGAAMAAAFATWKVLGYDTVVLNRNFKKAQSFVEKMVKSGYPGADITAAPIESFESHFSKADIIVYTLPIAIPAISGLSRKAIRGAQFWKKRKSKVILEANYKDPAFTSELKSFLCGINPGITFISGKEWLLHQAVGAYRSFTGEEPNIEEMRKVL